jgi:predicted SAM-dependent methyltransferase
MLKRIASSVGRRLGATKSSLGGQPFGPAGSTHEIRRRIADAFLTGDGIEIGALHQPLQVPSVARVKYVDRMTVPELRRQYAELADEPLVETDIIDNGELLSTIGDSTQDFVVANHFIEHCQNPIATLQNLLRVLKPAGILYMAVPDKRFTFDIDRPCTTIEHLIRDYREGPEWSKRQHFEEWSRLVNKRTSDAEVEEDVRHLLSIDYSIHFHVWTEVELLELVAALHPLVRFELELFIRNGFESILILRKSPP